MAAPKYYYNEKTLRYERAGLSIRGTLITIFGVLITAGLFFAGLLFLQNHLVTTATEQNLRAENKALKEHYDILYSRIAGSKVKLASLEKKEEDLTKKFFDTKAASNRQRPSTNILLNDKEGFEREVENLNINFASIFNRAWRTNTVFAHTASLERSDLNDISRFPGLVPIERATPDLLVSGYGTRINPWHKGKFHHDGIDFAGNRGDDILSAGNGTVSLVKKSELTAGFGNYIEIDHGHGYVTRYTHLGDVKVRQGQQVIKGQTIALIGISGGSIAPHLHYEVMKDGHHIDPMRVLVEGIGSDQFHAMAEAASQPNQTLD